MRPRENPLPGEYVPKQNRNYSRIGGATRPGDGTEGVGAICKESLGKVEPWSDAGKTGGFGAAEKCLSAGKNLVPSTESRGSVGGFEKAQRGRACVAKGIKTARRMGPQPPDQDHQKKHRKGGRKMRSAVGPQRDLPKGNLFSKNSGQRIWGGEKGAPKSDLGKVKKSEAYKMVPSERKIQGLHGIGRRFPPPSFEKLGEKNQQGPCA